MTPAKREAVKRIADGALTPEQIRRLIGPQTPCPHCGKRPSDG